MKIRRLILSFVTVAALLALQSSMIVDAINMPATPQFQRTWARTDKPVSDLAVSRTWMWGPDGFTGAMTEAYLEAPGGQRTVQYFDKSRMEDNSYRASNPWDVTNGLLVVEMMTGQMQTGDNSFQLKQPAQVNVGGDADDPTGPTYVTMAAVRTAPPLASGQVIDWAIDRNGNVTNAPAQVANLGVTAQTYVPETNHRVASVFWSFMNSSGLVWENNQLTTDQLFLSPYYATGFPVTEAYWANIKVANTYQWVLIQAFERRVLTYTPGNAPGWQVEAGNVGQHYHAWRYGPAPTTEETVWVVAAPSGPDVSTTSGAWATIPNLQRSINLSASSDLSLTISGEAETTGADMFVRVLVDGQPTNPSDSTMTATGYSGVHSVTFVLGNVAAGQYQIEAQWLIPGGNTAYLGDRTLSIVAAPSNPNNGDVVTRWAHGAMISTNNNAWIPIPDMSTSISTVAGGDLAVTLSASAFTSSSMGRVWVRALVDGQPIPPGDVIFAQGDAGGSQWRAHSMTFSAQNLPAGNHNIQMEWFGDPPHTAYMGDRTLTVVASPASASKGYLASKSIESGWMSTSSTSWDPIPGMNSSIVTPVGSDVAITLSAEVDVTTGGQMFVRVMVDGQPINPSDVLFAVDSDALGTRAFTFTLSGLSAGSHNLHLQWATNGNSVSIGDRTVTVMGWPVP